MSALRILFALLLTTTAAFASEMPKSGAPAPAPTTWRYIIAGKRPPRHVNPDDCNVWAEKNYKRLAARHPFYVVAYVPRFAQMHMAVAYDLDGETWVVDFLHGNHPVKWNTLGWKYWRRQSVDGNGFIWIGWPPDLSKPLEFHPPHISENYFDEVH